MTNRECYDLSPTHYGDVAEYSDGVYTHPLCRHHAERYGFVQPESADDLLRRLGY